MYAIVEIAGQQFKVEKDQKLFVQRLHNQNNVEEDAEINSNVEFDRVLLVDNGGNVTVGTPTISGAKVSATVLSHVKGDKVLVFHKKRRKGLRKLNGHRQYFTEIKINDVIA
ncbi:MAG: 50S ribosomal protein L21 [Paludibacteraceae bacterium]|nr:50S ribosomal protein L21 [Candidatus Physcocola equi]MCQ2233659.1 50S ribosomal protein L21 [Paludibacteraceae bacterium]